MPYMTRGDYVEYFDCLADAVAFEEQCLSIGTDLLPEYIRVVRDKEREPDSRYWTWLIDQWLKTQ